MQFVRLYQGGELLKMSKRTGTYVTVNELVEEVGRDAARFFFVMRSADSLIDFDMDLAKKQSADNPVYYVQYAHARIHSILAAELGRMDEATKFFGYATRLDLDNYNRNTCEGLHTTSIAMAWVNIVYGFAGLRSDDDMLHFAPRLPDRWKSLRFSLTWQGRILEIEMHRTETVFTLRAGEQMEFLVYGKRVSLGAEPLAISAE